MLALMTAIVVRRMLGLDLAPVGERGARPLAATESVVALIAGLSFVAGLVHVGASIAHFSTLPFYATAFAFVAALQICWAVWVSRYASRSALIAGLAANVAIVTLWASSLIFSVRVAAQPLAHPHTVYLCFLSVIHDSGGGVSILAALTAILPELVIAVAAACLLTQAHSQLARRAVPKLAAVLLATMFLSVLYGVGGG
jgi:hypothetical protein